MRIKKVAEILGVSSSYIRRLESLGVIKGPDRDRNDHRRYTERDVEALRRVIYSKETPAAEPGGPPANMSPRTDKVNEVIERLQRERREARGGGSNYGN